MTDRVDVFDLSSEIDLRTMERLMNKFPDYTLEIVHSPYIMLVWKDESKFNTTRISYFERASQKDMKLAEEIINSGSVQKQELNVGFPFAFLKWKE